MSKTSSRAPTDGERRAPAKPSQLAERVANAFRSAAEDAVRLNRERGNPVVGEVNGKWRLEKKTTTRS